MEIKVGTDIIEVERIEELIENTGDRFINRVFTDKEVKYCENTKKAMYQHYAARFAAKEATFKATSSLLKDKYSISWKNVQVVNDKNGRPKIEFVSISKEVEKELKKIISVDISLSHLKEYAIAVVNVLVE